MKNLVVFSLLLLAVLVTGCHGPYLKDPRPPNPAILPSQVEEERLPDPRLVALQKKMDEAYGKMSDLVVEASLIRNVRDGPKNRYLVRAKMNSRDPNVELKVFDLNQGGRKLDPEAKTTDRCLFGTLTVPWPGKLLPTDRPYDYRILNGDYVRLVECESGSGYYQVDYRHGEVTDTYHVDSTTFLLQKWLSVYRAVEHRKPWMIVSRSYRYLELPRDEANPALTLSSAKQGEPR